MFNVYSKCTIILYYYKGLFKINIFDVGLVSYRHGWYYYYQRIVPK